MNTGEAFTFVTLSLGKIFATAAVAYIAKLIKDDLEARKKSFFDDATTAFVNSFSVPCPDCQKMHCWDPYPEIEKSKKKSKKEEVINHL